MAVVLTLAGPRFWILIKALLLYAFNSFTIHIKSKQALATNNNLPLQNLATTSAHIVDDNLEATAESHSELGAAFAFMENIWKYLGSGRLNLPSGPTRIRQIWPKHMTTVWRNLLQRPFDVLLSLLVSVFFVAIFVAESSGTILSANIVSDTTALVSSPKCQIGEYFPSGQAGYDYARNCYHAELGANGCNFFYNQSIAYTENHWQKCPFTSEICANGSNSAMTLDTGLVDAKVVGINSAAHLQFRRTTTCAPLKIDGEMLNLTLRTEGTNEWLFYIDGLPRSLIFGSKTRKSNILSVPTPLRIGKYRGI